MKKKTPKNKKETKGTRNGPATKNDLKEILKETTFDFKRYVGAINEDFQHKTKAIAEQYSSIQDKLNTHTEMIGELTIRITSVEQVLTIMKEDIEFIKSGLKKKVNQEEFDALVRRVSVLEKQRR